MARGALFITGTDTDVGKSYIATAVLHALRRDGLTALGFKPVASGAERIRDDLVSRDAQALQAAGSFAVPLQLINPYCFEPPIAPHIAAELANTEIHIERIRECYAELAQSADWVIVEGAGGWRSPLAKDFDNAELAQMLELPVLLVVGLRLGCLHQAVCTLNEVKSAKVPLVGWVANEVNPEFPHIQQQIEYIEHRSGIPCKWRMGFDQGEFSADVNIGKTLIGFS